jgi:inosine/xanthosine triphosphate pyrophosphatase family protein
MNGQTQSVGAMDAQSKNRQSHRALAAKQMMALMHEVWRLPLATSPVVN